jgi:hypothetical protein
MVGGEPQMTESDWAFCRTISRSPDRPSSWPTNVFSISMKGLCLLGVDDKNRLYWDGQRIPNLVLSTWQKVGAVMVTLSAVVGALATAVSAYAAIAALA